MIDLKRPPRGVVPLRLAVNAQGLVDGRGQVLRRLWVGRRERALAIRGADHRAAADAAAGQEHRLHRSPVLAARQLIVLRQADLDVDAADLDRRPWITVVRQPIDTVRPALLAACERAGFVPDIAYETSDPLTSLSLVAAGLGYTVVQASLARAAPAEIVALRAKARRVIDIITLRRPPAQRGGACASCVVHT